jgi:DNA-binding MarR family transcriptional regulator
MKLSSKPSEHLLSRGELLQALVRAIYENSTAAVFFHNAIGETVGLGATDEKTMLILSGGPLTVGEIAQHTGLTSASATSLIDRLERKGFVERIRDIHDRRKVIVRANEQKLNEMMQAFGAFEGLLDDLIESYTDEQLAMIVDFISKTAQRTMNKITEMNNVESSIQHDDD